MDHHESRRLRVSSLSAFIVLGFLESAWGPMVPYVKSRFGLDDGELGMLLLCTGAGAFAALPLVTSLARRLGCLSMVRGSAVIFALVLALIPLSPSLAATAALLLCFGAMTVSVDVSANINAVIVESRLRRPLMSGLHGGYSVGTLMGSAFMSAILTLGLGPVAGAASACLLALLITLRFCGHLIGDIRPYEEQQSGPAADAHWGEWRRMPRQVGMVGVICFIAYAIEGAVIGWSAVFATEVRGLDLGRAGFIYTFYAIAMTLMRFAGNRLVLRLGRRRTIALSCAAMALGWALTVLLPGIGATCLGFVLIGLGAANVVPQLVSYAGTIRGYPVHSTIAIINAIGYSGILLGPVIIGHASRLTSLSVSFLGLGAAALLVGLLSLTVVNEDGIRPGGGGNGEG